jgi:hypothetical protein
VVVSTGKTPDQCEPADCAIVAAALVILARQSPHPNGHSLLMTLSNTLRSHNELIEMLIEGGTPMR